MAYKDHRQLYIQSVLLKSSDYSCSDRKRELVNKMLTEAFTQKLIALEEQFGKYQEQLLDVEIGDIQLNRAKKLILSQQTGSKPTLRVEQSMTKKIDRHFHREALKNCSQQLRDTIDLKKGLILDKLVAGNVLSNSDEENVRDKTDRTTQNNELLSCLVRSITPKDFHKILLPALVEEYPAAVDTIVTELKRLEAADEELCAGCTTRRDVKVKRIASALHSANQIAYPVYCDLQSSEMSNNKKWMELKFVSDSAIIDAMETQYPDLHQELMSQENPSLDCRCAIVDKQKNHGDIAYRMSTRPVGKCLIINNTDIAGPHSRHRFWSNIDKDNLERVFSNLEFEVITKTNLSAREMKKTAEDFAKLDHTKYDAFVCCILTQGNENGLYGADGIVIPESNLTAPFRTSRCPSLAGKPKLFFFQANRVEVDPFCTDRCVRADSRCADDADFLFGYCTTPVSDSFVYRTGSRYISALTETLDHYADKYDLLTCLRMVNKELSDHLVRCPSGFFRQVSAPVFTLTKQLHLTSRP